MKKQFVVITLLLSAVVACTYEKTDGLLPDNSGYEEGEELSAGKGSVFDATFNAYNHALPLLSTSDQDRFVIGNSFNRNNWVTAPASTTARDGLGPFYNALSCSGCHILDGKGNPPLTPSEQQISLVFRLSIPGSGPHGEPVPVPNYGDQLNIRAIQGITPEGSIDISYIEMPGTYADGSSYSLRKPVYTVSAANYGAMPANVLISPRVALRMNGSGYLDAIAESTLLAWADENDADHNGISGKPNYVWDEVTKKTVIGRIGWKSGQPGVKQQVAHAFLNDIGITSSIFPDENLYGAQKALDTLPNGGSPEITDGLLDNVYFYTSTLAVPARRNVKLPEVLAGKKIFTELGCANCHKPSVRTTANAPVAYLSNELIHPYTDLLLHDMGPGLSDNRPEYLATGNEWRTAPLWGIGVQKVVNRHSLFLHDGRARGFEEAILWHGGEAENAKQRFKQLDKESRMKLLSFLESL